MKHVLLFYPTHKFGMSVQPRIELPLSLLTVATPLDRAGYHVRIIDQRLEKNWRRILAEEVRKRPICVGITSMTGPQIRHGLEASRIVRELGSVPVVWGGIHPTLLPQQTVENENVDIVVEGEGEETFIELVQALENDAPLDRISGIWYKAGGEIKHTGPRPLIDLNSQPPLSYHLVDVRKYFVKLFGRNHLSLETSRGCHLKCNYCYNTRVFNSRWRGLTADETIRRIKMLKKDFGVDGIIFSDDMFFGDKARAINIFRRIKEEKLDISYPKIDAHLSQFSRLTDSELTLLKDAGGKMVMMGIESGAPRMLEMMNKKIDIDELLQFNKRLMSFDLMPIYFFMMGYPTETLEELSQTIALYLRLISDNENAVSHLNVYTPFPGTGLFDVALENGFKMPEKLEDWVPCNWRTVNDTTPWLSAERRKIIRMLHFSTLLAEKNTFLTPYKKTNPLIVLAARLYHPIARKRVEKLYYKFPIEIKLAELMGFYPKQT